ncbi:MAG TPA: arylsulfatase [Vicinamibacterales bacterium]
MRPTLAVALAAAVSVLIAGAHAAVQSPPPHPNILLIQADDLGYGDLSSYGQTHFRTPSLDALAAGGIRFTQYYAGSTVCAPSRTALMTGFHTGHTSIRGNLEAPLPAADVTVAMALHDAGYRTAVIGKWGIGNAGTTGEPSKKGFDYAFGFLDQRHAHRQYTDHLFRNGERYPTDLEHDYVNDLFTRETLSYIDATDPRPFFIYLNYTAPHAELRAPEDSMRLWRGKFPETPFVNAAGDATPTGSDQEVAPYRSQATPKAAFVAMVTRMDRDIGTIAERLRVKGIERNTLLMFVSDNGPHQEGGAAPAYFNSSGGLRGIKRDLYEGGIRVPFIASWPGTIPAGRVSAHPWAHWDLFPTLAEIGGAKTPPGLDGFSMARALRGAAQPTHDAFYWEFHESGFQQAARMGRWKSVRLVKDGPLELYDLDADPAESHDVAAAHADVVKRIDAYLKSARTDNPLWPVK